MENELLKGLYDCFYTPPELSEQEEEVTAYHKALIEALAKPERKLVLRIIDAYPCAPAVQSTFLPGTFQTVSGKFLVMLAHRIYWFPFLKLKGYVAVWRDSYDPSTVYTLGSLSF